MLSKKAPPQMVFSCILFPPIIFHFQIFFFPPSAQMRQVGLGESSGGGRGREGGGEASERKMEVSLCFHQGKVTAGELYNIYT